MKRIKLIPVLILFLVTTTGVALAEDAGADPWKDLVPLMGTWKGSGEGFGQTSPVTHTWSFVFGKTFLRLETVSGGEGAKRGDIGYISFDQAAQSHVFRQFFSEGFVNTYDVLMPQDKPGTIVFEYKDAESAGPMKARLVLTFKDNDHYTMVLELASGEDPFAACQTMDMTRQ